MKYNYEKKIKIIIFELLSELLRSYNESTFLKVFFRGDLGVVIKIKKNTMACCGRYCELWE